MEKAQVIIQTAFLGDLILSIPFLLRVKKNAPSEKLVLVCKKGLGSFLKHQGVVDDFVEVDKGDRQSYKLALAALKKYDITYLYTVHRSTRSLLFSWQLKAQKKIGFKSAFSFLVFDETVPYEKSWPDAVRKFKLLSSRDHEVGEALKVGDFAKLSAANANGVMPAVPSLFALAPVRPEKKSSKQVALFPGSVWATKRWTEEGFTEVARELVQKGFQVLLLGGPDEKSLCDSIAMKVPEAKVLAGQLSIQQSIDKVAECDLVIANDSAATHMAALKNTPSITIFGPTTLELGFRPWNDRARVVQIDLDCRPCGAHGHQQCPLGHHHCMKWISSAKVFEKAIDLLKK
jgi:heptosyltransferase-2